MSESIASLKRQLAAAKRTIKELEHEKWDTVIDQAFGEHLDEKYSQNWRHRVGNYRAASEADLVKFHAVVSQPKFAGQMYELGMGVLHRLLRAESQTDTLEPFRGFSLGRDD